MTRREFIVERLFWPSVRGLCSAIVGGIVTYEVFVRTDKDDRISISGYESIRETPPRYAPQPDGSVETIPGERDRVIQIDVRNNGDVTQNKLNIEYRFSTSRAQYSPVESLERAHPQYFSTSSPLQKSITLSLEPGSFRERIGPHYLLYAPYLNPEESITLLANFDEFDTVYVIARSLSKTETFIYRSRPSGSSPTS